MPHRRPESAVRESKGGYSHVVTNSGPVEMRFIAVDLERSDKPGTPAFTDEVTVAGGKGPGTYQWHGANAANPVNAGTSGLEIVELEPR